MSKNTTQLLLGTELLSGVPTKVLQDLTPPPDWIRIKSGDFLIREGEMGEAFFLLVHGRLRVFARQPGGRDKAVGDILPGDGVGEMSLLSDEPTNATVRAVHDCELIRFSRESYIKLMRSSPDAALEVTRSVIRRLRKSPDGQGGPVPYPRIATLAVDPAVDIAAFNKALTEKLGHFGSVVTVSPSVLNGEHAAMVVQKKTLPQETDREINESLASHEDRHDLVVLAADGDATEWTRLCLARADLVVLVTGLENGGGPTEAETAFLANLDPDLSARTDLVVLHGRDWLPYCGADQWLATRNIAECHHLRTGAESDMESLARKLTGHGVNLVLGGGGARGLAQIGYLRAFEEAGLPIDRIAGSGMGAIIAALYATGKSPAEIVDVCREIWIEGKPLSDYTFPALSVIRGRRLRMLIHNAFEDWRIEDLPRGFFCVSGNLTKVDAEIHDKGPLWKAVAASSSVIGAGPPVFMGGNILVDGGIVANVPGDVMRERFGGAVIESDVSRHGGMSVPADMGEAPSGWDILLKRLLPLGAPVAVPGLFEVLAHTATLSGQRLSKLSRPHATLSLAPPVERFSETDFEGFDEIVEAGYRHAMGKLSEVEAPALKPLVRRERLADTDALPTADDLYAAFSERRARSRRTRRRKTISVIGGSVLIAAVVMVSRGDHLRLAEGIGAIWSDVRQAAGPKGGLAATTSSTLRVRKYNGANVLPVDAITLRAESEYEVVDRYAGRIVSRRTSSIGFEQSGRLVDVMVTDGDRVTKGQPLARIDTRELDARRRELEADLKQRQAVQEKTRAQLQMAGVTEKRRSKLLLQNNVSRQSYDQSRYDEKALKAELLASRAEVEKAKAALEKVNLDITKSTIFAPFDGVVVERLLDEGSTVEAGAPVIRVIESGLKEVRVGIAAPARKALKVGREYEIEIDGETSKARLSAILPSLNAETRTVTAILYLPDPDMAYQDGDLVRLRLKRKVPTAGYWVPTTALIGGRRGLWNAYALEDIGKDGLMKISQREVQVLYGNADRVYVRGTLRDGERLVSTGVHRLIPGQIVHINEAPN